MRLTWWICSQIISHLVIIHTALRSLGPIDWSTALSRPSFSDALSNISRSYVLRVIRRYTFTAFCCPIRWQRACACRTPQHTSDVYDCIDNISITSSRHTSWITVTSLNVLQHTIFIGRRNCYVLEVTALGSDRHFKFIYFVATEIIHYWEKNTPIFKFQL